MDGDDLLLNKFDADGSILLKMIESIKYEDVALQECRATQKESWRIKD